MNSAQNRKRANKRQRELLVERLHANIELARGNSADSQVVEFWALLALELNRLGCQRTVEEWQHIWTVWIAKTKAKARKVRDAIRSTGGGPAEAGLTDVEERILDIIGSASVDGFGDLEVGLPTSTNAPHPEVEPVEIGEEPRAVVSPTVPRRRLRARRRTQRPPRPPMNQTLIVALQENARLLREDVRRSAESISAAMVQAAEILADAIRTVGTVAVPPAVVQVEVESDLAE